MNEPPTIGCLGKLTLHGDFVRLNHTRCPGLAAVDRWLLEGMERGYADRGKAFETDLRAMQPLRLLHVSPETGGLWNGLVLPSADRVGRVYPFIVGWQDAAPPAGPEFDRLPLVGQPSMAAVDALVAASVAAPRPLPEFLAALAEMPFESDANGAEQALRSFTFGTTADEIWAGWPGGNASERRRQALFELWHLGQPPYPPRYLTAIPYRGQAAEVAFWLTLVRQWLPAAVNPTLVAWPARTGAAGTVRLLYDRLDPRYFGAFCWPGKDGAAVLDLGRDTAGQRPVPEAERFATLLPDRGLLHDLILAAGRLPE